MKILLKKKILEIIHSMEEANSFLRTVKSWEVAAGVLTTCMQTALKIGTIVEEHDAAASKTVKHLNAYCEAAYQLYQCTLDSEEWIRNLGQLDKYVAAIKRSIVEDLSDEKIKVVFLPYNASMWDSFDSVYEAAQKDPDCQVSVVPIPYYSLGPNREIVAEHYEGKEISAYADITDYRAYDIAKECPDMVFIHNPYDGYNNVTQVHPQYFSSQLIKYTSHLVYIPYYITAPNSFSVLLFTPGVKNAWRIIVQNKARKQKYIEAGISEEKVAALGSPKFDMIIKQANQKNIPENWQVLKGKRVFFYNTHLQDIINNSEAFLTKLRYVISVFHKHQETALLWRPHPLSIETIKSMNPAIMDTYLEIIEDFRNEGNGVYDDTADLDRSIALSDGYIGEEQSSVSLLFQSTKKPMYYVNNYNPRFMQRERYIRCLCGQVVNGKIFMFSWEYNHLFMLDVKSKRIDVLIQNQNWPDSEKNLYTHSIQYKNYLYFTPLCAQDVLKYNTKNGEYKYISIENTFSDYNPVMFKEKMYLMPVNYCDRFPCINLIDDQVTYIETDYQSLFSEKKMGYAILFYGGIVAENQVWRVCKVGPYIQTFHLETNRWNYIKINGLETTLRDLAYDGTYFWCILETQAKVIQWDPKNNRILETVTFDSWLQYENKIPLAEIAYCLGSIWILPRVNLGIIRLDPVTKEYFFIDFSSLKGLEMDKYDTQPMINIHVEGTFMYLLPYHSNGIIVIDTEDNSLRFISTKINFRKMIASKLKGNIWNESMCCLEDFIVLSNKMKSKINCEIEETVGKKVWCYLKEQM